MGSLILPEDLTPPGLFGAVDLYDAVSSRRHQGRLRGRQHQGRPRGREEGRQGGRGKAKPAKTKAVEVEAVSGLTSFNHRASLFNWGAVSGSWRPPGLKQMVYDGELNNVETVSTDSTDSARPS